MNEQQKWFFPTNTENLEIFLSSALIVDINGFSNDSYMKDAMDDGPVGYIPFFCEQNLNDAIVKSRVEDENLVCCLIELDLSQLRRNIAYADVFPTPNEENNFSYHSMLELDTADAGITTKEPYRNIQIPAPLPLQCIKNIIFESKSLRDESTNLLEKKFGKYPNKFFIHNSKLFKESRGTSCEPSLDENEANTSFPLPANNIIYDKIHSLGGMLALSFYQTKNGAKSIKYFNELCALQLMKNGTQKDFEIINNYFFYSVEEPNEEYTKVFYDLIKVLSEDKGTYGEIKKTIFNYLERADDRLDKQKEFISNIFKKLSRIEDRTLQSPEVEFDSVMNYIGEESNEKYNKKIVMLLVMYFFRDKPVTMLKFYHKEFKEIDYLLFSMFFGISSQYIGLPEHIKKIKDLNFYISNLMSEFHHKKLTQQEFTFKKMSPPKFIPDLIKPTSNGKQDSFISWLSDYLDLDSSKFQTWTVKYQKGFDSAKSTLRFDKEPKVELIKDTEKSQKQAIDYLAENSELPEKSLLGVFVENLSTIFNKFKHWEIKSSSFSCDTAITLTSSKKPILKSLVDISELERQFVKCTVNNEKDLFDYNKVLAQYVKLTK